MALLAILLVVTGLIFMGTWEDALPSAYMNNMLIRWLMSCLVMVPMILLIIQGKFDLSVGGIFGLTAFIMAQMIQSGNAPVFVALLGGLAIACLFGLLNGFLIGFVRLHWAVVTLGTMVLTTWIAFAFPMLQGDVFKGTNPGFLELAIIPAILLALSVIISILLIELTPFGYRKIMIQNSATKWIVESLVIAIPYLLTGLSAGIAGAWFLGYIKFVPPNVGYGFETDVLLIVLMGGAVLGKRYASLVGGLFAAAIVLLLEDIFRYYLVHSGWSSAIPGIAKGILILLFGLLAYLYYLLVNLAHTRRAASRQATPPPYIPVPVWTPPPTPAAPTAWSPPYEQPQYIPPPEIDQETVIEPRPTAEPQTEPEPDSGYIEKTVIEPRE